MRRVALMILMSIAVAAADDKDKLPFKAGPASSYPGFQSLDKITIAAVPFVTKEQAQTAFGKVNPYDHGILPVLVVLENATGKALRLDLQAEYVRPDRKHLDAIPPQDTSSRFLRDRQFWGEEGFIQPGKVVGWIFATEEQGARMK